MEVRQPADQHDALGMVEARADDALVVPDRAVRDDNTLGRAGGAGRVLQQRDRRRIRRRDGDLGALRVFDRQSGHGIGLVGRRGREEERRLAVTRDGSETDATADAAARGRRHGDHPGEEAGEQRDDEVGACRKRHDHARAGGQTLRKHRRNAARCRPQRCIGQRRPCILAAIEQHARRRVRPLRSAKRERADDVANACVRQRLKMGHCSQCLHLDT